MSTVLISQNTAFKQWLSRAIVTFEDGIIDHWLLLINSILGIIVGGAFIVPILAYFGVEPLAGRIFSFYHTICDQIPSHSFFLFGHQIALCSRNLSLYGSILIGTLIFRVIRHRLQPIDWRILMLFLLPMALDGGTQLFGWRESTDLLRIITGLLFGFGLCLFVLPFVQQAVDESTAPRAMA